MRRGHPPGLEYGFIAQEVEEVIPEVVSEDAEGFKMVAYARIVPVLTSALSSALDRLDAIELASAQQPFPSDDTPEAAVHAYSSGETPSLQPTSSWSSRSSSSRSSSSLSTSTVNGGDTGNRDARSTPTTGVARPTVPTRGVACCCGGCSTNYPNWVGDSRIGNSDVPVVSAGEALQDKHEVEEHRTALCAQMGALEARLLQLERRIQTLESGGASPAG